jgi:hypothetical protein
MTAFYIMLSSLFELAAIFLLIWGYVHENKVIAWENKVIAWENKVIRKAKKSIRNLLRKNKTIVAWANGTTELDNSQIWSKR